MKLILNEKERELVDLIKDAHTSGRITGYLECINILLDCPFAWGSKKEMAIYLKNYFDNVYNKQHTHIYEWE